MDVIQKRLKEEHWDEHLAGWVSTPDGRISMEILRARYYDVPSFDMDPLEMARIGGQREIIEELLDLVKGE